MLYFANFLIFIFLSTIFYFVTFGLVEKNSLFLTITTFLFSIFAGFFISRQGTRYAAMRRDIADFDGEISNIHRDFEHFGKPVFTKAKKIIRRDYEKILDENEVWDFTFNKDATIIADFHNLLKAVPKKGTDVQTQAISKILGSLRKLQIIRKRIIIMYKERIPTFQWILLIILACILLVSVAAIPSYHNIIASLLKGIFVCAITFVFILLEELNKLNLFERIVGEDSAKDVLAIINKK